MDSTLVKRTHILIAKFQKSSKIKYYAHAPRGIDWQEKTIARPRPPLIRMHKPGTHVSNLLHNFNHTCMLRESQTSTQAFFIITLTSMTLISLPPYLKTIIKYQIDHSIQFTSYDSFYYTQLGCSSFQDQLYDHRKYHAVIKDSQNNISEA